MGSPLYVTANDRSVCGTKFTAPATLFCQCLLIKRTGLWIVPVIDNRNSIKQLISKPDRRHEFNSQELKPTEAADLACNDTFDAVNCLRMLHEKGITAAASASFACIRDNCDVTPALLSACAF